MTHEQRRRLRDAEDTVRDHWQHDLFPSESLATARDVLTDVLNDSDESLTDDCYRKIERLLSYALYALEGSDFE